MSTASIDPEREGPGPGGPILTVTLEGQVLRTIVLGDQVITVGRLPDNILVLADPRVSRKHAELRLDPGGLVVTDLASASGTFHGTKPLLPNRPVVVPSGDPIRIGPYVLTWKPASFRIEIPGREEFQPVEPIAVPVGSTIEPSIPAIEARPTFRPPLAIGPQSRYLYDLPAIFQELTQSGNGDRPDPSDPESRSRPSFLSRMLLIYESLWEPLEQRQDQVGMYYDPRTCPSEFLPFLAGWLQLSIDRHWPEPRRRRLLRDAMDLYRWRGTPYGLTRMIEVCTGLTPTVTEDKAQPHTFNIKVWVPPGGEVRRDFVKHLVEVHKPAHVGYTLEFLG